MFPNLSRPEFSNASSAGNKFNVVGISKCGEARISRKCNFNLDDEFDMDKKGGNILSLTE